MQDGKQINIYSIDDSKKQRLKKIDNIQAMVGIVTKLEGKNNNFAVIFNEQRKCDYSVNLNRCKAGVRPRFPPTGRTALRGHNTVGCAR